MGTIGDGFSRRRGHFTRSGAGIQQKELPKDIDIVIDDFTRGYSRERISEATEEGQSPSMLDLEIDRSGRLVRAPGISVTETLVRVPSAMFLHPNLDDAIDVVLIAPPYMGIRQLGSTVWYDVGLPSSADWSSALHAGTLLFTNNTDDVYARETNTNTLVSLGWGETAVVVSFAGRVFAFNTDIGGVRNPLGVKWTGSTGEYDDTTGAGSGFELLLDDSSENDRVVAAKSIGFDMLVIVLRKAIWIGRPTGDENRPVDFMPRIPGIGAVNQATVYATPSGVMLLSDDGVKLFDGNAVKHMSQEIDADLLPLDYGNIRQYSAVYAPQTQIYTLFTGTRTYDYSFVKGRWTRRSLIADRAVAIHNPLAFNYSNGSAGWGNSWGGWWGIAPPSGPGASNEVMLYQKAGMLGAVDPTIITYFGEAQNAYWQSPERIAGKMTMLTTVKEIDIGYVGEGAILIEIPDYNGDYTGYAAITLGNTINPRIATAVGNITGIQLGIKISYVSGSPKIEMLGARVAIRSERRI